MFCPQCGTNNPAGTQFCVKCGTALSAPATPPVRASGPSAGQGLLTPQYVELSQYAIPLGGVLMFIGTFLPWVSFLGYSANGFGVGFKGILVFLFSLVLIGGYVALRMMPTLWDIPNIRLYLVIALGAIALLSFIFAASGGGGFGAILALLGALIAAVGAVWVWFKK